MNHDESSQPTIHDSDNSMTEDSDAEEPAWKKTQLADVNINFDRIQVVPSVAITGDELPLEFFTRFIDDDVIQLLVFQTNLYATQSQLKNWHDTNEVSNRCGSSSISTLPAFRTQPVCPCTQRLGQTGWVCRCSTTTTSNRCGSSSVSTLPAFRTQLVCPCTQRLGQTGWVCCCSTMTASNRCGSSSVSTLPAFRTQLVCPCTQRLV